MASRLPSCSRPAWGPGKVWERRSSRGLRGPLLGTGTASHPMPCYSSKSKASPGSRSGRADPVHHPMGEAVQPGVKGFGHRQRQRLGGRFAIIIAHQVSRIFHPFFPFMTHTLETVCLRESVFDWELENQLRVCICVLRNWIKDA